MIPRTRGSLLAALTTSILAVAAAPAAAQVGSGGIGTTTTPVPGSDGTAESTTSGTETGAETGTGTDAAVSQTKAVKLTRSQTKSVQRRAGVRADGKIGARTRTALRRYQRKRHLTRTGRPNLQTLKAMRLRFAEKIERKLLESSTTTEQAEPTSDAAPAATGDLAAAIAAARGKIGAPYASGGNGPSSFDCSGLTVWAFKQAGISLPRTSFEQYEEGIAVEREAIQPGDLVFFDSNGSGASHVGIATSATTVISATSSGVKEHSIASGYWDEHYVGARRVTG